MDEQQQDQQSGHDADPFAVRPTPYARLEAGVQLPGALDHAWLIDSLDQQHSFDGNASKWEAHARCIHCGARAAFRAQDVPPCRPGAARP